MQHAGNFFGRSRDEPAGSGAAASGFTSAQEREEEKQTEGIRGVRFTLALTLFPFTYRTFFPFLILSLHELPQIINKHIVGVSAQTLNFNLKSEGNSETLHCILYLTSLQRHPPSLIVTISDMIAYQPDYSSTPPRRESRAAAG